MASPSISIIVPCYNEEGNIERTVRGITHSAKGIISDYEILLFNDCSSDRTGEIADRLVAEEPKLRVIHNQMNRGLGYNYYRGLELASKTYVIMIFGDNEVSDHSIAEIFRNIGKADMILPYISNPQVRQPHRRLLSASFVRLINCITRKKIRYYNGPAVHLRENVLQVRTGNMSFAYMAEIVALLLKRGASYIEIPFEMVPRPYGRTHALRVRNFVSVGRTIFGIALSQLFPVRHS